VVTPRDARAILRAGFLELARDPPIVDDFAAVHAKLDEAERTHGPEDPALAPAYAGVAIAHLLAAAPLVARAAAVTRAHVDDWVDAIPFAELAEDLAATTTTLERLVGPLARGYLEPHVAAPGLRRLAAWLRDRGRADDAERIERAASVLDPGGAP
jgi:hypothetical protein